MKRFYKDVTVERADDGLDIARVSIEGGDHIGALTQNVKIERQYTEKIKTKHTLTYYEFGLIQEAINRGTIIQGAERALP